MSKWQVALPLTQDQVDAEAYWSTREFKVFAVDVSAGPERRPTYCGTYYARSRHPDGAIRAVKREVFWLPSRARFKARLAGPRELGCQPTPGWPS